MLHLAADAVDLAGNPLVIVPGVANQTRLVPFCVARSRKPFRPAGLQATDCMGWQLRLIEKAVG